MKQTKKSSAHNNLIQKLKILITKLMQGSRSRPLVFAAVFALIGGIIILTFAATPSPVTIFIPKGYQTVSGPSVAIDAGVKDVAHVKSVNFYINDQYLATAKKTIVGFVYVWDTSSTPNSNVKLTATAYYDNRTTTDSTSIALVVHNTVFNVPDKRSASDPNQVIDPTGVKDSTAGLQAWLSTIPNGTLYRLNTVVFPAGAKYRVNGGISIISSFVTYTTNPKNPAQLFSDSGAGPQAYPWRVRAASTNTDGRQSAWFMDEFKDLNNHGTLHSQSCTGCSQGGFDGYLSGYQNDSTIGDFSNQHGFAVGSYFQHPFVATDKGKVITACTAFGCMNRIISGVLNCATPADSNSACSTAPDSSSHFNMVTWDATQALQSDNVNESSNGWVRWAINTSAGGWQCYFTPNPSYNPKTYSGSWNDFESATNCAMSNNRSRTLLTMTGAYNRWSNIQIHGSNTSWNNTVENFDNTEPAVSEFQHDISLGGNNNELGNATIDDAFGDGLFFNGTNLWVHGNRIEKVGRQAVSLTGIDSQIILENNVIQEAHHSDIDVEPDGGGKTCVEDYISVLNNTFGGPHGIAMSPGRVACFSHFKISGNHSTNADVSAGTIASTTPWVRGESWGPAQEPGSYMIVTNNVTDNPGDIGMSFKNLNHIWVSGNSSPLYQSSYFTTFNNSAIYNASNNKENCSTSCNLKGQINPASTAPPAPASFTPPGTANVDSWWAKNGPDPNNFYRNIDIELYLKAHN